MLSEPFILSGHRFRNLRFPAITDSGWRIDPTSCLVVSPSSIFRNGRLGRRAESEIPELEAVVRARGNQAPDRKSTRRSKRSIRDKEQRATSTRAEHREVARTPARVPAPPSTRPGRNEPVSRSIWDKVRRFCAPRLQDTELRARRTAHCTFTSPLLPRAFANCNFADDTPVLDGSQTRRFLPYRCCGVFSFRAG